MSDRLRLYLDPAEIGLDGYPYAWHNVVEGATGSRRHGIKDIVRARDGHRCLRCGHPYQAGMGEWSPCDEHCTHRGPAKTRAIADEQSIWTLVDLDAYGESGAEARLDIGPALNEIVRFDVEAQWRILTVHHLSGVKHDCRWWNLVSLCQRCHLLIQAKVHMERPYHRQHSEWFRPFAAAYYAYAIAGVDIPHPFEPGDPRVDEYLALELREHPLF